MAQVSIAFCKELDRARKAKGMTQSALAEAVGCTQSAISMVMAGRTDKLSQESIEKMAEVLGVKMPENQVSTDPALQPPPTRLSAFCPNAFCPSNIPYVVNGDLLFWPTNASATRPGARCPYCGELLETRCPTCGAPIHAGACCTACGTPKVTNVLPPDIDVEHWAAERRKEITAWRALIVPGKDSTP